MASGVTRCLLPFQGNNGRSGLSTLPEVKEVFRPRSNSSGCLVPTDQLQSKQIPRVHSLQSASNQRRRYSVGSEVYNYGAPITIIHKSSSIIECAVEGGNRRKKSRCLIYLIFTLIFIIVFLGVFGVIASKALPKPDSYCIGEHFCIPVKASMEKVKMNLSAIKEKVDAEATYKTKLKDINENRRNLIPRAIPRVIGKIEQTPPKQSSKFSQNPDEKLVKSINDVVRLKTPSPFMHREANIKGNSHNVWQSEWHDQWDNRQIIAPPGVNPKIYLRNEL